jgi:hypothetical protein
MSKLATVDVTFAVIDAMEGIHGGLARRARATLGITAWGMQVLTLPPEWDGYPEHDHGAEAFDPDQEEVYVPIAGSRVLLAGDESVELVPGTMARVVPTSAAGSCPTPRGSASSRSEESLAPSQRQRGPSLVRPRR